jgi:hypothetical protein
MRALVEDSAIARVKAAMVCDQYTLERAAQSHLRSRFIPASDAFADEAFSTTYSEGPEFAPSRRPNLQHSLYIDVERQRAADMAAVRRQGPSAADPGQRTNQRMGRSDAHRLREHDIDQ